MVVLGLKPTPDTLCEWYRKRIVVRKAYAEAVLIFFPYSLRTPHDEQIDRRGD